MNRTTVVRVLQDVRDGREISYALASIFYLQGLIMGSQAEPHGLILTEEGRQALERLMRKEMQ